MKIKIYIYIYIYIYRERERERERERAIFFFNSPRRSLTLPVSKTTIKKDRSARLRYVGPILPFYGCFDINHSLDSSSVHGIFFRF